MAVLCNDRYWYTGYRQVNRAAADAIINHNNGSVLLPYLEKLLLPLARIFLIGKDLNISIPIKYTQYGL